MAKPDYIELVNKIEGLKNVIPSYYAGNANSILDTTNVVAYWPTTSDEKVRLHGSGSGSTGGASISEPNSSRYFIFLGSSGFRQIEFIPFDNVNKIKYLIIRGNNVNGLEIPDNNESLLLEMSTDGGTNWSTMNTIPYNSSMTSWTEVTEFFTPTTGMIFRFRQPNNSGGVFDNYGLDNVRFYSSNTEIMRQDFDYGVIEYGANLTSISGKASVTDYIKIQEINDYINSNIQLLYTFSGFTEELTQEERDLFNYVSSDYIEDNPGSDVYSANTFYPFDENNKANSYVGVYYDENEIE